jgi:formylglycine-generating enzyme required for sulfatase activity
VKFLIISVFSSFFYLSSIAQSPGNAFVAYDQKIPGSDQSFKMAPVKAGSFTIGTPANEKNREADETPQKTIQLSAFWMGVYEVTRDNLDVFLKDENTSLNSDADAITRPSPQYIDFSEGMGKAGGYPANSMSQRTALMYCRWLYQKTGVFYRLPTEAEWEYACRAGSSSRYYFGDNAADLDKYAWYEKNSGDKYHKVGQKLPNAFGLYDMLGNLLEWTLDHYEADRYAKMEPADPMVPANALQYPKVLRGGGFTEKADDLHVSKRFHSVPAWNVRDPQIPKSRWWLTEARAVGFRIMRPLKQPSAEEINQFFQQYLD